MACGCCHTDVHAVQGDWFIKAKMPLCPGHEGVGVVREVGSLVKNLHIGDHVGIPWLYWTCGACEYCLSGWETLCLKQRNCGYSVDGCFSKFVVVQGTHAVPLPKNLRFQQAARKSLRLLSKSPIISLSIALLCAGVTSYKALKETEAKPGEWVCIVGAAGGLGHLAVQYGRVMGYRVLALDVGEDKLEFCRSLGAELAIDVASKQPPVVDSVLSATNGGCHGVVVLAPHPAAYGLALDICRRKGTIVCVAMPKHGQIHFDVVKVVINRITIRGSIVGTREDMREAVDFAARGLINCDVTVEKLEQVNEVMDKLVHNQINGRVVFEV